MDGGLPYDDSINPDPAFAPVPSASAPDADGDHPMLDRPLDDYTPAPEVVPEHVQTLLGRMAKNKIYLVEESPGIVHRNDEHRRIRGDARIAELAEELDKQDPSSWLAAVSAQAESPIKENALFVSSELIKHLSTSKVFTWATGLGAAVMGIEWLNDTTLLLVFPDASATLIGLSVLSKAGFDPREGDDPLLERSAHPFPISLLPLEADVTDVAGPTDDLDSAEAFESFDSPRSRPPRPTSSFAADEIDGGDASASAEVVDDNGVRRKGRGAFSSSLHSSEAGRFDLPPLAQGSSRNLSLAAGIDPNERITIRYAMETDSAVRRQAKQSEWYKRHGRSAGKEVSLTPRRSGRDEVRSLSDRVGTSGEGREFARRIGRERERDSPYARPERRERKGREDLDAELERMAARRATGEVGAWEGNGERRERRDRPERRERRGKDDLDKELDELFAARSTAS